MFENFYFPDGTQPLWDSLNWLQKDFMMWFNEERLRCLLTFPVESFALIYKDGKFVDEENAKFVADELERGHSFFIYISDTADSLSSCCRLKNKIQTKEFSFTNGNIGVETGSKSVITLNFNRITQDFCKKEFGARPSFKDFTKDNLENYRKHIVRILERVYKYHNAYNELLWDMYNANLLPIYKAGFIELNKQYLTIGINGLNQAAEFLKLECHKNDDYSAFCRFIFGTIKDENEKHKTKKTTFNTEQVPAESLAVKNYNWDKEDGYWVPEDTNLYASYIFKPNDDDSVLDKLYMMGKNFATDQLDGGAAAHINLSEHLSSKQYYLLLEYAAKVGCSYWTVNVPNAKCECGFITKHPITECPRCGSKNIEYYDRVIGYLTKISNWSEGRRIEQKNRKYLKDEKVGL
jgi:ribonucleoside-triphosphate reductase